MATFVTPVSTWDAPPSVKSFANAFGQWTAYTPELKQSAAVNCTILYAKYIQVQKTVVSNVYLSATAAGTAGSVITISLPVAAASTGPSIGSGSVFRTGTGMYVCQAVVYSTSSTVAFINDSSGVSYLGAAPSYALANGDVIRFSVSYEVA